MYVEKITIWNFRCFAHAEVSLNYPGNTVTEGQTNPQLSNVNLFLGNNGAGKSSVFQAVALCVLSPVLTNSGFKSDYSVRRRLSKTNKPLENDMAQARASLRLHHDDLELPLSGPSATLTAMATITRRGDYEEVTSGAYESLQKLTRIFRDNSPAFFLVGYGANRRTERQEGYSEQSRSPRYQRVASLFESHVGLIPFSSAYYQFELLDVLDEVRELLNRLLPPDVQLRDENDARATPLFHVKGADVPFSALSDGYRTFIGWVWDLLLQLARVEPGSKPLTEIQGVVIVDEIDLFLHPEWQRRVVGQVATTFPHLQFLFSTHSPLVAGTLEAQNIFVMDTDDDGAATVKQYDENIHGLSASQVLTSSYFGLSSTRAPQTGSLDDLAARAINGDDRAIYDFLGKMSQGVETT